jgi:hypothetical protein
MFTKKDVTMRVRGEEHEIPLGLYKKYWLDTPQFSAGRPDISSHWEHYLEQSHTSKISRGYRVSINGLASYTNFSLLNLIKSIVTFPQLLSLILRYTISIKILKAIFRISYRQHRFLDFDLLRQALALNFVIRNTEKDLSHIAIIGDGFGNLGALISFALPNCSITFINLGENLFLDALSMHTLHPVANLHSLVSGNRMPAQKYNYLESTCLMAIPAVDAYFNLASFGEMNETTINSYFDFMKENAAPSCYLYSCNRVKKIHPDGSTFFYANLPFYILQPISRVEELCPWHQKYPTVRFPFFKKFDGPVLHTLVKFENNKSA